MKYNKAEVISKATDLYWEKGFHATSMRTLQETIDMRPGSIYACFGSKEGLFKEVLQHYADMGLAQLDEYVANASSPLSGLKDFMMNATVTCDKKSPSGMCFLAKTVAELTVEQNMLLTEAKRLLAVMEQAFAKVLASAQSSGEIPKDKNTNELASYFQVQMMGLRSYGHATENRQIMAGLVTDVISYIQKD